MSVGRRKARREAVVVLYQGDLLGLTPRAALERAEGTEPVADPYTRRLVLGVGEHIQAIDDVVSRHLAGWTLGRLGSVGAVHSADRRVRTRVGAGRAHRCDRRRGRGAGQAVRLGRGRFLGERCSGGGPRYPEDGRGVYSRPMRLLDQLDLPADLRRLDPVELRRLAGEIREEIISTVSQVGGHLGPSLGVVELTIALHAELRSPEDHIVWDVGHQSYPHKLLTGRLGAFSSIRRRGGLSGFPKRSESEHDAFGTGHSSTSVSVGVGLAEAARLSDAPRPGRVISVIGDGALTGGMAYEGLNQAGHLRTPLVVVLNDNDMSIKKNVGAMSSYLSRLRTEPHLYRLRRDLERRVQRLPGIGERVYAVGEQLKDGVKGALVPGMLFEELGFTYIGVVDGHDIESLRAHLRRALAVEGPVLLHVKTVKGKGYVPAERAPDRFHGTSPFAVETGVVPKTPGGRSPTPRPSDGLWSLWPETIDVSWASPPRWPPGPAWITWSASSPSASSMSASPRVTRWGSPPASRRRACVRWWPSIPPSCNGPTTR